MGGGDFVGLILWIFVCLEDAGMRDAKERGLDLPNLVQNFFSFYLVTFGQVLQYPSPLSIYLHFHKLNDRPIFA